MSTLVLHMSKFKKDAIRGIQSHNRRERESHSNPDIDYSRSVGNYDLHESASDNYAQAIQNRIDDLLMVKAVRKDAVHMCGLIVSSDKSFFTRMGKEETRRFFEEAAAYLTDFVGKENVISAMVHILIIYFIFKHILLAQNRPESDADGSEVTESLSVIPSQVLSNWKIPDSSSLPFSDNSKLLHPDSNQENTREYVPAKHDHLLLQAKTF